MPKILALFSDGASKSNPGDAGYGFVVYEISQKFESIPNDLVGFKGKEVLTGKKFIGTATNNEAEWLGLQEALKAVFDEFGGDLFLQIFLDSQLVVRQVTGQYKVKKLELKPYFIRSHEYLKKFEDWEIYDIRREYNKRADQLANIGIEEGV